MKTIIHLLSHTLENDNNLDYHIEGNWASRLAKNTLQYTDIFQHEVWYPVRNLKIPKQITKDHITYKLFPAKTLNVGLESYFGLIYCPLLFQELKKHDPKTTLIHVQGERGSILHGLLLQKPLYSILVQYHGYGQPPWLDWMEKITVTLLERITFPWVKHFFVPIRPRVEYLTKTLHIDPDKISFKNIGVDFSQFRPRDKLNIRKKVGLPLDAFIILYVGSMVKTKGVDVIIKAYEKLRQKHPKLYLLFIGARADNPLYAYAKERADKVIGVVANNDVPFYYNASDVYCLYGTPKTVKYGGVGIASYEALASNLNVISTNLIHFPDPIVSKVGFVPSDYNEFVNKLEFLIRNPTFSFHARSIVEPYISNDAVMKNIIQIYHSILET